MTNLEIGRFEDKFWKGEPFECWLWRGSITKGYGKFRLDGKIVLAHRIAYLLEYGKYDENLDVCHTCDTPACVNPNHLFLGTHQDNMRDMLAKGHHPYIGKVNPTSYVRQLTDDEELEIAQLYKSGGWSQRRIARHYNISQALVFNITRRY